MAKYTGPVCRLCRREGEKLFLKGSRCFTPKCGFEKRGYAPGQHGKTKQGRSERESDYARQLRAKQRARRVYGVLERLNLLQTLEMRLDNAVFRLGLADSRAQARQLVNHGHFVVNGRRADIPSMLVKPGDAISATDAAKKLTFFKQLPDFAEKRPCAVWMDRDLKNLSGRMLRLPERAEIDGSLNEQLIVEYYSR